MRRLLVVLAIFVLAAGAGAAVRALTAAPNSLGVVDGSSHADLRLWADRYVTPLGEDGLRPGSRFRYSFHVKNTGDTGLRHIVVRSVQVASPRAGTAMVVVHASDPACWAVGHSECIFPRLEPGQTRTVHVTAETSTRYRPGDALTIHTFIGRFATPVDGSVTMQVVGEAQVTTGRFR